MNDGRTDIPASTVAMKQFSQAQVVMLCVVLVDNLLPAMKHWEVVSGLLGILVSAMLMAINPFQLV